MKRTLLRWHLGLGDALLCNGLVRVLVERGHQLVLPCWPHNTESVRAMLSDLGDAVSIRTDNTVHLKVSETISLGGYGENFDPNRWDESFYRQAGVPFLAKWEKFKIGAEWREQFPLLHNRFIHDDPTRGFNIPIDGHRVTAEANSTIFDHHLALVQAEEIHCISSCFAILADLVNAPGKKYLHRYARPDGGALPIFGREWTILDKPL